MKVEEWAPYVNAEQEKELLLGHKKGIDLPADGNESAANDSEGSGTEGCSHCAFASPVSPQLDAASVLGCDKSLVVLASHHAKNSATGVRNDRRRACGQVSEQADSDGARSINSDELAAGGTAQDTAVKGIERRDLPGLPPVPDPYLSSSPMEQGDRGRRGPGQDTFYGGRSIKRGLSYQLLERKGFKRTMRAIENGATAIQDPEILSTFHAR